MWRKAGSSRTANQGRTRRTRAAEAEEPGVSGRSGAGRAISHRHSRGGDIDRGGSFPAGSLSLTDLSDASKRAYENGVRSFIIWAQRAGVRAPAAVTRLVLRRYLAYMATRHYARQTMTQRASALRRYFGWLSRHGVVDERPDGQPFGPSGRVPAPPGAVASGTGGDPGRTAERRRPR